MNNNKMVRSRPNKIEHFFNRAKTAAERSTCLRRKIGAVIINDDGVELSSGYVGSPRGTDHCIAIGNCLRMELGIKSGRNYELCRSVHAEQNAIINAARIGVSILGAEIYIYSEKISGAYQDDEKSNSSIDGPCIICKKEIINAGLIRVHMKEEGVGERTYSIEQIKEKLLLEEAKWRNEIEKK
ncbi:cytidine/deoxycytidylate deaminase family protein [Chloroflexota bacterium]